MNVGNFMAMAHQPGHIQNQNFHPHGMTAGTAAAPPSAMMVSQQSQQPQVPLNMSQTPQMNGYANGNLGLHVDRVNGIGMWRSWTRSFNTPLLALLDLFDNAVDASMIRGNVAQHPNQLPYTHPKIAVTLDEIGSGGIMIRNSCESPIPPMKQVLEVYKSSKNNAAIGENGIGVKHACANLSTLSIILSKTFSTVSIGIVMEELQKPEGVILPSAFFDYNYDDLHACLLRLTQEQPAVWGVAMQAYGEGSVELGLDRILKHFKQMTHDWKQYNHVFTTLITKLRHRGHLESHHNEGDQFDDDGDMYEHHEAMEQGDNNQWRSLEVLQELRDKLPKLYIHIHAIDVSVQHQAIDKLYWERRLAEATVFEIPVNPTIPWRKDPNCLEWNMRGDTDIPRIRFIVGFDPYRAREKKQSACRLYLYSRESGRLIREFEDARAMLHLVAGSTDYTQGLTILLDDANSTLPLNPTKQDLAFGFTEHGQTHRMNLMEWTSAVTNFVWTYHFERLGGKKSLLTAAVLKTVDEFDRLFQSGDGVPTRVPPISAASYTTYPELAWKSVHDKIRVNKKGREEAVPAIGRDSLVRLSRPTPKAAPRKQAPRKQAPRKVPVRAHSRNITVNTASSNKNAPIQLDDDDDDDDDDEDEIEYTSPRRAAKRRRTSSGSLIQSHAPTKTVSGSDFDQWQLEKQELQDKINEKDKIIGKLIKDKQEEARQRVLYQNERNEFEEKLELLQMEKDALEQQTKSSGDSSELRRKLEKRNKKYYDLKEGYMALQQVKDALEKELDELKESSAATVSPSTPNLASSNDSAAPNPVISSSTSATEEELRTAYKRMKQSSDLHYARAETLERRVENLNEVIKKLEEENKTLNERLNSGAGGAVVGDGTEFDIDI